MISAMVDPTYFRHRADEERDAAARAETERARESHSELARRYLEAAQSAEGSEADEMPGPGIDAPEFRIIP